jgi:hypothetical protein
MDAQVKIEITLPETPDIELQTMLMLQEIMKRQAEFRLNGASVETIANWFHERYGMKYRTNEEAD